MSKAQVPELKKFIDKDVVVELRGKRLVSGRLRGYDIFLNLVLDDATEDTHIAKKHPLGQTIIRGNVVNVLEPREAIRDKN